MLNEDFIIKGRKLTAEEWGSRLLLVAINLPIAIITFYTLNFNSSTFFFQFIFGIVTAFLAFFAIIMTFKEYKYSLLTLHFYNNQLKILYKNKILKDVTLKDIKLLHFFNLSEKKDKMCRPFLDIYDHNNIIIIHIQLNFRDYNQLKTYLTSYPININDEVIHNYSDIKK
ncbi:hypothetical protein [Capnocytophaga periodontitidis]|uniref:hypothetical protein n=1 Tax=Capnocytophaga periodontitidis TaxID=2795027 RepID=UPI0018E144A7|nr:hypothetical protein [Capnocytophaga periodontitidis]MBI1667695.1 hypothetical protein [Capnocytophaga periodontitidis]